MNEWIDALRRLPFDRSIYMFKHRIPYAHRNTLLKNMVKYALQKCKDNSAQWSEQWLHKFLLKIPRETVWIDNECRSVDYFYIQPALTRIVYDMIE